MPTLAGTCLGLAFISPTLSWLLFVGLCLTIYCLRRVNHTRPLFLYCWIIFGIKSAIVLHWFWYVYPIPWLPTTLPTQLLLIGVLWTGTWVSIGFGAAIPFLAYIPLRTYFGEKVLYLFPFLLVLSEVCGSFLFSIYSLGPSSVPNINFGFGYLGYAVAAWPGMLTLAKLAGVYGLSFVVSGLGVVLFGCLRAKRWWYCIIVFLLILLIGTQQDTTIHQTDVAIEGTTAVSLATRFSGEMLNSSSGRMLQSDQLNRAVRIALSYQPDYVILPEDSRLTSHFTSAQAALEHLSQLSSSTILLDSARTSLETGQGSVLRSYTYNLSTNQLELYDKQYLVPQGEFVAYWVSLLLRNGRNEILTNTVETTQNYRPGPNQQEPDTLSILFCFESASPLRLNADGHAFVAHIVSHAWFHSPSTLWYQLQNMLRVQAAWSDIPIIVTSNQAPSYMVDATGRLQQGQTLERQAYWTLIQYGLPE